MKKFKLSLCLVLAVSLAISLLTGCGATGGGGGGGKDQTTFTFATWAAGPELKEFQAIVDSVNEKAEGRYKVEVLSVPSDYYIKISTFIASKKTPDFFWLTQELISKYAQLGAVADITEPFSNSTALNPTQYYEGVVSSAQFQDRYYGLPWIANPLMVYYNKTLFDDAGVTCPSPTDNWNWDEFIEIAKKLSMTKKDSMGNDYKQYGYIVDGWPNIETFIWAGGGDIIDKNGTDILLDSEASLKGLDLLHTILTSGITPSYSEVSSLGSNNVWFEKQRAAMFMGGIQDNFEKKISELPDDEKFEIGYAPVPVGADGRSSAFDWTASTVMKSELADNALAYEVLETMTLAFFDWKVAPPLKNSAEAVAKIDPFKAPALETIQVSLNNARSANYIPEWNEINNFLWVRLYTKMLNDTSFDYVTETKAIAAESRDLISKRK